MKRSPFEIWRQANNDFLGAALEGLRERLLVHPGREPARKPKTPRGKKAGAPGALLKRARAALPAPSRLDHLRDLFGLSEFETQILLLCAAVEWDATFPALCAQAQPDPKRAFPTFSLALAALAEPSWEALSPAAPLRFWRLVEVNENAPLLITTAPLRIDESILHYLLATPRHDERLAGLSAVDIPSHPLVPSHHTIAQQMAAAWSRQEDDEAPAVLQLCGEEVASKRDVAAVACAMRHRSLWAISIQALPAVPSELDQFIRLCEREARLSGSVLMLDADDWDESETARAHALQYVIERMRSPLIVSTRRRREAQKRPPVTFEIARPTLAEQREVWMGLLHRRGGQKMAAEISRLVLQFDMSAPAIRAAWNSALAYDGEALAAAPEKIGAALWDSCRRQTRSRLEHLSQRLEPKAQWEDLVLPPPQKRILGTIRTQVQHRARVYEDWGFLGKGPRGLGIVALFAGASGTGKTMAAEVLADELRLDLYRIDLSAVVSKFIGETEKNMRLIFDAAEESGAILLFDEADALFGKRSEVKDSHDRHANIEVSYLLQRLEAYRGLAILTTNLKESVDTAFLRRLRFVVHFPFPDPAERENIWRRVFPAETPCYQLDYEKLKRLNVSGGNIRNIALHAAFLAAEADEPVTMRLLERAARDEYLKAGKSITEPEIRGWI